MASSLVSDHFPELAFPWKPWCKPHPTPVLLSQELAPCSMHCPCLQDGRGLVTPLQCSWYHVPVIEETPGRSRGPLCWEQPVSSWGGRKLSSQQPMKGRFLLPWIMSCSEVAGGGGKGSLLAVAQRKCSPEAFSCIIRNLRTEVGICVLAQILTFLCTKIPFIRKRQRPYNLGWSLGVSSGRHPEVLNWV